MPPIVLIYLARPKQVFGAQGGVELQKAACRYLRALRSLKEAALLRSFVCCSFSTTFWPVLVTHSYTVVMSL